MTFEHRDIHGGTPGEDRGNEAAAEEGQDGQHTTSSWPSRPEDEPTLPTLRALLQSCERVSVAEAAQRVAFCYGSRSKWMQTNSYKGADNKNENMSLAKSDGPAPLWKVGFLFLQYCSNLESEGLGPGGPRLGLTRGCRGTFWAQPESRVTSSLLPLSTHTSFPFVMTSGPLHKIRIPGIIFSVNFSTLSCLFL